MSPTYKRWYDHDPLLLEVIELLKNYQTELRNISGKDRRESIKRDNRKILPDG